MIWSVPNFWPNFDFAVLLRCFVSLEVQNTENYHGLMHKYATHTTTQVIRGRVTLLY